MAETLDIKMIPRVERRDSDRVLSPEEQRDLDITEYTSYWVKQAPVSPEEAVSTPAELPRLRLITKEDYEASLKSKEFIDPPKPNPRSLRVIRTRILERLKEPEKVINLIDFLAANGVYEKTKRKTLYRKDYHTKAACRKAVTKVQKKEHFIFTGEGSIEDFIESRDDYSQFERVDKFGAKSSDERKALDEFCQKVEDPVVSIKALYHIGIYTNRRSFNNNLSVLSDICVAAQPHLSALQELGAVANWKKISWENGDNQKWILDFFETETELPQAEGLKDVCTYFRDNPSLFDLPLLGRVAADSRSPQILSLLRVSSGAYSDDIQGLNMVNELLRRSLDPDLFIRIQESGFKLENNIIEYLSFYHYHTEKNKQDKINRLSDIVKDSETEGRFEPRTLWLAKNLTVFSDHGNDWRKIDYTQINHLSTLDVLKGYEKQAVSYMSCVKKIFPNNQGSFSPEDIAKVVKNPERLTLALDPEYVRKAAIVFNIVRPVGIHFEEVYGFINKDKPSLYDEVNKYGELFGTEKARHLAEYFQGQVFTYSDYGFQGYDILEQLIKLLKIKDIDKVIPLVGNIMSQNLTLNNASFQSDALEVIAENNKYREALEDERLPEVCAWLFQKDMKQVMHYKIADKTFNESIGIVVVGSEIIGDQELYEKYLDENQRDRSARFADLLHGQRDPISQRGYQSIYVQVDEALSISESDIEIIDNILAQAQEKRISIKKDFKLADIQYFSTHEQALEVGYQRVSSTDQTVPLKWDLNVVALGEIDNWKEVIALRQELFPDQNLSAQAAVTIAGNINGFRELYDFFNDKGIWKQFFSGHSTHRLDDIVKMVDCRQAVIEVYQYFEEHNLGRYLNFGDVNIDYLIPLARIEKSKRDDIMSRVRSGDSFNNMMGIAAKLVGIYDEVLPAMRLIDKYYPDGWDLPWSVNALRNLQAISNVEQVVKTIADLNSESPFDYLNQPEAIARFLDSKGPVLLEKARLHGYKKPDVNSLHEISDFADKDTDGEMWDAFIICKSKYKISFNEAIKYPDDLMLLASSEGAAVAYARVLQSDIDLSMKVEDAKYWDEAGKNMSALNLMLELHSYKQYQTLNIREIGTFIDNKDVDPQVIDFVKELHEVCGFYIQSADILPALETQLPRRAVLLSEIRAISNDFPNFKFQPARLNGDEGGGFETNPYKLLVSTHRIEIILNYFVKVGHINTYQGGSMPAEIYAAVQKSSKMDNFFVVARLPHYKALLGVEAFKRMEAVVGRYVEPLTGTENDKITPLVRFLGKEGNLQFTDQGIIDMADFINTYGIQYTAKLYEYFSNIRKHARGELEEIPAEQVLTGLNTEAALKTRFTETRARLISGVIPAPEQMSDFDYDVLAAETMFHTSRWRRPQKDIKVMHRKFHEAQTAGRIAEIPEGYETATIEVQEISKKYDMSMCEADYQRMRIDLLVAYELVKPGEFVKMRNQVVSGFKQESDKIDLSTAKNPFMLKALEAKKFSYTTVIENVLQSSNQDQLLQAIYEAEGSLKIKKQSPLTSFYIRRILLLKSIQAHTGYEEAPITLMNTGPATLEAVQFVRDIVKNVVKSHVLNEDVKERQKYFSQDCLLGVEIDEQDGKAKVALARMKTKLAKIIAINNIEETLAKLESSLVGRSQTLHMVPDRGFIGELSGYYSEACYTGIDKMLENWTNVVPDKIVEDPDDPESEIIGAVLYIESTTAEGEKVIIIRAINPRDKQLNILQAESFCEQIFNRAATTAKKRGCTKVLVAGKAGTISNRAKIIGYVRGKYVEGRGIVPLESSLNFNSYKIQNACYLVREVV